MEELGTAQIHVILFVCKLSIQVGDHGLAQLIRSVLLEHSQDCGFSPYIRPLT